MERPLIDLNHESSVDPYGSLTPSPHGDGNPSKDILHDVQSMKTAADPRSNSASSGTAGKVVSGGEKQDGNKVTCFRILFT